MISIVLPDLSGGGAERVSVDLARAFAEAGHDVEFVLMSAKGAFLAETARDFSVVDLAVPRTRNVLRPLSSYLRNSRPEALIAQMWPLTAIAPMAGMLSGSKSKILVTEHNTLSAQYASWGRTHRLALRASMAMGYRMADVRVGVSKGVAQDAAALAAMPPTSFEIIHNPVAARPMPSAEVINQANRLWSVPKSKRIINVGSFKKQKNHALLLRAFSQMPDTEARLMLVGTGELEAGLRAQVAELGIADRVIFAGFQPDPTPFYATADIFVLSSNYEGFGNVIVEAMACGTPVVSTDCPSGPAEILANGKYGQLVPTNDATALANAIQAGLALAPDPSALQRRAAEFLPTIAARHYLKLLEIP